MGWLMGTIQFTTGLMENLGFSPKSLTSIGGYTNREYNITGSIDGDDNEVMSILRWLIE